MSYVGKTCPVCQTPIKPGIAISVCPACDMPYHQECWEYNGGCATYGCSYGPQQQGQRPAAPPPPAQPYAAPGPAAQPQWGTAPRTTKSRAWVAAAAAALIMVGVVVFALAGPGRSDYAPEGPPPDTGAGQPPGQTLPPPPPPPDAVTAERVRGFYDNWLSTWENRDLDAYLTYYAEDCVIKREGKPPYGKDGLRNRMRDNFAKNSYISIETETPDIYINGDRAELSARQRYTSSTWWDRGVKYLTIEKRGDILLIVEESFAMDAGGKN